MKSSFELRSVIDPESPKRFAPWVRALYGKNGVYAIFNRIGTRAEYVGVSTGESLYGTLTRHFQKWAHPASGWVEGYMDNPPQ